MPTHENAPSETYAHADWSNATRMGEQWQREARERHKMKVAQRKIAREAAKAFARQEGSFIGPPNPFMHRKGRAPMTVTR